MDTLDVYMRQLAAELEVEGSLATETLGEYKIPIADNLAVTITATNEGVAFSSLLAPCPKIKREPFFTHALLGNLFGQGTHGAVLGLRDEGQSVYLSHTLNSGIDYKTFRETLEDFMNSAEYWRGKALEG